MLRIPMEAKIMRVMAKKSLVSLLLFFTVSAVFSEEHLLGKMLIMGWRFVEEDASAQTNIAIDAIVNYAEAAKYQMSSEVSSPSAQIRLYKSHYPRGDTQFQEGVFIYINRKSEDDYFNRFIEINFYIFHNGLPEEYKLVLNYNDYNWLKNNDEKDLWNPVMRDNPAYDFFISALEELRR
jgi:hypothetical protein